MDKNNNITMKEFFTEKFIHIDEKLKLIFDMHKLALDKAAGELTIKIQLIESEIAELKKRPSWFSAFALALFTFLLGMLIKTL